MLLNARVGWQAAELDGVEAARCDGSLRLSLRPEAAPAFADPSGSFGGLQSPDNVAIGPDCGVYLLERRSLSLLRFDPCCCRFEKVPCFGGRGGEPRQLRRPRGITICGNTLYVCDTGLDGRTQTGTDARRNVLRARIRHENHRVSIYSLDGYSLRGHLRPPAARFPRWRPSAVACDRQGCVWVADSAGGALHRFDPAGRWLEAHAGFEQPGHLAIDACGRIFIVEVPSGSPPRLAVIDASGKRLTAPAQVADASPDFAPLPFSVGAEGNLDMRKLCTGKICGSGWFDASGNPLAAPPKAIANPLLTSGRLIAGPLDSKTHRCQWHRVQVHGQIRPGSRVRVETFCADEAYDAQQLLGFATWETQELAARPGPGAHDCLILSPPGRYLWLRLTLLGNGSVTPEIAALEIEFPRLTSLRYLPAVFAAEATSADFTARFLALFDTTLRSVEQAVDTEAKLFDPLSSPAGRIGQAPVDFLGWLASWIGVRFDRSWDEDKRRQFLDRAGPLLDWRGTLRGLREQLLILLGWTGSQPCCGATPRSTCACKPLNCAPVPLAKAYEPPPLILEHFKLRRWLMLGEARLGAQAVLWGSRIVNRTQLDANARVGHTQLKMTPDPLHDPFRFYANRFTVFIPACYRRSEAARKALERLLRSESPASVRWNVEYIEPRFRIGVQSMIGFDAVVGDLPAPAALGNAPLGKGTLLNGVGPAPAIRIGRRGRLGSGARIQ
jgi:phage tail-like protein